MMLASHSPSQINLEHEKQARYIEKPEEKIDFIQNETKNAARSGYKFQN